MAKVKAKVLKTFRDKETQERHIAGTEVEISSKARFEEINSKGLFLDEIEDTTKKQEVKKEPAKKADEPAKETEVKKD